jgi:hypothetical protein
MNEIFAVVHYQGRDAFMKWVGQSLEDVNKFLANVGAPSEVITKVEYESAIAKQAA